MKYCEWLIQFGDMCHITTWEEDYKGNNTSPSLHSPLANSSTPSCMSRIICERIGLFCSMWWPGLKNSPTATYACRKRRLKWVPSTWGYSLATLSPEVVNTKALSSRLGVGRWTNDPALKKVIVTEPQKGRPWPDLGCRAVWWWWRLDDFNWMLYQGKVNDWLS
jgi:hypothetical protein